MIPRASVLIVLIALFAAACGGGSASSSDPDPLRIGLTPTRAPGDIKARNQPLVEYLEEELGREIELIVPTSYSAVVEEMASGELDMANLGGLTYVQTRQRTGIDPVVADINPETGDTTSRSVIVVPSDSPIQEVSELRDKTFAFGSISSTSGSLYPSIMLDRAGIDYRTDLGETTYTGRHDATALAVADGEVDAGGLSEGTLDDLQEEGTIEEDSIRTIAESEPIEGDPWVVREALSEDLEDSISDAFLNMDDPELLRLLDTSGYEQVEANDYDYVEEQARKLGLLT